MAWSDEPTEVQIGLLYSWLHWEMDNEKAKAAAEYAQETATRKEVSTELSRLKDLKIKRLLNAKNCFESEMWEGFNYE